ncbi:uncharacterized protein BP5553_03260 [Venustampulla echinocandica]|uniref:Uncharacterized protein n=1 Tax=Venustampulla echinocandica TaxID=2656787 RepID=A0A370TTS8_9HELO|nr:uncharacterized protein BP5553_03260 [Venustampulla echinocandica]RDL38920.1 hypothetical protein BP5553_03260 [Venustampulla echinocandica]
MPVLYNSDSALTTGLLPIYVVLGSVIFLSILLILRRPKPALSAYYSPGIMSTSDPTKTLRSEVEKRQIPVPSAQHLGKHHSQGQNLPLPTLQPFTPRVHSPPSASTQFFVASPTETAASSVSSETTESKDFARRRSYSKALTIPSPSNSHAAETTEVQVSGEIVLAEGWRRHTRVFGGGVCMACEENQRRMTA